MRNAKSAGCLEGVPGGVAVVEDRALAPLALVLGHDESLGGDAAEHDPLQHRGVGLEQAVLLGVQKLEKASVHGDGVLYNLGEGVPVACRRQRLEGG